MVVTRDVKLVCLVRYLCYTCAMPEAWRAVPVSPDEIQAPHTIPYFRLFFFPIQAYAAQELYSREWRFHSVLKLWFKRVSPQDGNVPPGVQYIYFDHNEWERQFFAGNAQMIVSWCRRGASLAFACLARYLQSEDRARS